jgi:anti-sigma factor RsiW
MTCLELDDLLHPFLDGELMSGDRVPVERHVEGCARCREIVGHEAAFKQHVRARLRARPQGPVAHGLEARVRAALDRADLERPGFVRRAAPAWVALAAAAFLAWVGAGRFAATAASPIVEAAIAGHMKNLPVEVGGTRDDIRTWMQGKVAVPVRPPRFQNAALTTQLVGARVYHLASRDVGQIVYRTSGGSQITVYVFDPAGWELSAPDKQVVDGREVYLAERAGYTVALYRDRGVGYALASDLGEDDLVKLVAASLHD